MAQGEFWVERQNWARWPKVIKVNRETESGTEMRRYVRKPSDFGESHEYALQKIAELKAENAKLRELVRDMWRDGMCECDERGACAECEYHFPDRMRELGVEEPSRWATCECGEDVELFDGCHEAVCPSCGRVVRG